MEVIEIIIIFSIIFIAIYACLIFFPHYIRGAISGNWEIDIGEWWYEFIEYKQINLLVATLVLYLIIIIIWTTLNAKIRSKKGLVLETLSSLFIVFCVNKMYWTYLDNSCLQKTDWWSAGEGYIQIYGSLRNAQFFAFLIIVVFLVLSIVSVKFDFFIKDPLRREIVQKIVSKTINIDIVICFGLLIYLILPETDIFVYQSKMLNVVMCFWIIGMMLYLIYDLAIKISHYKKFLEYCLQAKKDYKGKDIWIVVNESNMNEESFFFYKIFINTEYQRALYESNIKILPKKIFELLFDCKAYVILDIYGNFFINAESVEYLDKVKAYSNYCMAYCPDKNVHDELGKYYDKVLDEIEDVLLQLLDSQNLIFSKKNQSTSRLFLGENLLDCENCIIRELNMFKENYYCNTNQFMIFDYSIKWMETINYFYSIILISLLNIDVEAMSDKIKNATFGIWKEIREKELRKGDKCENINIRKKFKTFIEKGINNEEVIEKYKSVYEEIYGSKKNLENKTCSISFLLAEFSKIRNYTRGHGVYTFKITESLNENVLYILLYLMNRLIESKLLGGNFDNLSMNGWVLYKGEDVYFCYSKDEGEEEYEYCCFSLGETLRFPVDFFRGKNNEEE